MKITLDDTIVAVSTALGEGGIGIVRLSGSNALKIVSHMFLAKDKSSPLDYKTYTTHYGWIVENSSQLTTDSLQKKNKRLLPVNSKLSTNNIIDEVILTVMRAPKSYTKEDVVEINCHGGIVAMKKVLELAVKNNARIASPGEFTRRAFINGRIDLSQAEAVLDIIRAKTETALNIAMQQLKGHVSAKINNLRQNIMEVLAQLEAAIDFPEEDILPQQVKLLRKKTETAVSGITELLKDAASCAVFREGIKTVICGRPNVGKSSLMNALLKKERVIVTPVAGTTRDVVEEVINIRGIPVVVADTAGIVETRETLEKKSVEKTLEHLNTADLIILVVAGDEPLNKDDIRILNLIKNKKLILAVNKIDLKQKINEQKLRSLINGTMLVHVSAKKSTGIDSIEQAVEHLVWRGQIPKTCEEMVTNTRHIQLLEKSKHALQQALLLIDKNSSEELVACEIKESIDALGQITGEVTSDDILEMIFSQFCVGK